MSAKGNTESNKKSVQRNIEDGIVILDELMTTIQSLRDKLVTAGEKHKAAIEELECGFLKCSGTEENVQRITNQIRSLTPLLYYTKNIKKEDG